MMRLHRFTPGAAWLTVLMALMLTVSGCSSLSNNSPTAPGDTATAGTSSSDTYAEAFIRADEGGSLMLGSNRVYFPAGALDEDTTVSILRQGDSTVFDLSPDGIQFNKPVVLTLEMAPDGGFGANKQFSFPVIYYYDEASSHWQNLGGIPDFDNRVITVRIHHFSRYGTGNVWSL